MKITNLEQGSTEWLAWRLHGLGSSDAAAIIGMNPYRTALDVFDDKTGRAFPEIENAAMTAGKEAEPVIRSAWELFTGKTYTPTCAIHNDYDCIRASFDGYCADDGSIIEIKHSNYTKLSECLAKQSVDALKKTYPQYYAQTQHLMLVSDAEYCDLVTISPDQQLLSLRIDRDDAFIYDLLLPSCIAFWNDNVLADVAPELYATIDNNVFDDLSLQYLDATEKATKYKELADSIKAQLVDYTDDGSCMGKYVIMKRTRDGIRINYKKACEDNNIDLTPYQKETIGYYRIQKREN